MKKIIKIILVNIILISLIFYIFEVLIWGCENIRIKLQNEKFDGEWPVKFHPGVKQFYMDLDYFPHEESGYGRYPVGLEYKKSPIVIFGCSFAYGFELNNEQSFHYKLSQLTKRPVYNRANPGWGVQHMYSQVKIDKFYEHVPEPEYVIYLMIHDHFRRLYAMNFFSSQFLEERRNLRFKLKNGSLVQIFDTNKYLNMLKRLYLTGKLHQGYVNNVILSEKNHKNYFDFTIKHFIDSKKEMEKHWKNTKYVVALYHSFENEEEFTTLLENQGFTVISIPKLTTENLSAPEYNVFDGNHPSEKAWDLLTPKIIDAIGIK